MYLNYRMDYYKRMLVDPAPVYENYPDEDVYVDKMQKILSAYPCIGVPREPTLIMGCVYVGSTANSENIPLLKSLGITHILNCATSGLIRHRRVQDYYPPETGILGYEELPLEDNDYCDIRAFFERAMGFIKHVASRNGRVLIHCPAVSRSGAIAIAFLLNSGFPLLEATKLLKDKRRVALCNTHFMRQLVRYARDRGMLESGNEVETVRAPVYHRRLNHHRIYTAHLPLYV